MSGLSLLRIFDSVYLIALAIWLGSLVFLTYGMPLAHRRGQASSSDAPIEYRVWSRGYLWCVMCGALALPALVCGALGVPELRGIAIGIQAVALLLSLLMVLYTGNVLLPRLRKLESEDVRTEQILRLRDRATSLNSVVIMTLASLMVAYVFRGQPTSKGIEEPTPAAAQQAQLEMMRKNEAFWRDYRKDRERQDEDSKSGKPELPAMPNQNSPPDNGAHESQTPPAVDY